MNVQQESIVLISASVVVYRNDYSEIKSAILSFFQSNPRGILYLVDNSPITDYKS